MMSIRDRSKMFPLKEITDAKCKQVHDVIIALKLLTLSSEATAAA